MSGGTGGGTGSGDPGNLGGAHGAGDPAGPGDPAGHGRPEGGQGVGHPRRGIRRRVVTGVAVVTALAAAAVAVGLPGGGRERAGGPVPPPPGPEVRLAAQLTTFDACPAFLSYVRGHALEQVGDRESGEPTVPPVVAGEDAPAAPGPAALGGAGRRSDAAAGGPAAASAPVPPPGSAAGTPAFSGTNVQVAGIDEPDTVKTDGTLLVSLEGDRLRVVDAAATMPRLRGVLALAEPGHELLLLGDKAVVFGARQPVDGLPRPAPTPALPPLPPLGTDPAAIPEEVPEDALVPGTAVPGAAVPGDGAAPPAGGRAVLPAPPAGEATVTVVDLADPDRPRVLRTFRITGTQVAARVVAGEVRLVLRTEPPVPGLAALPGADGAAGVPGAAGVAGTPGAAVARRMQVERSTVDDWLPGYRIEGDGAPPSRSRPLVACEDVLRPDAPESLSMITVVTVDPDASHLGRATSVVGGGDTVYAEQSALYVAGTQFPPSPTPPGDASVSSTVAPTDAVTQLHQFDVRNPEQAQYVASGQVQGRLLDAYALSAADGRLRVATTRHAGTTTDNAIVVLEPRGQQLVQVGQVGGLGVGEEIYAVRYVGDVAWVVTFRRTDPLYAVDLSDPTRPTVRGELKLPGFSTYLLPLPGQRLLGIGESAERSRNGTKLALFDISDLSAPRLLDDEIVPGVLPQVTADPHAFLWWEPARLAVVPVVGWGWGEVRGGPAGLDGRVEGPAGQALAFRVDETISPAGRLGRSGEAAPVTRTVVVGDRIFAISVAGVQIHDLAGLAPGTWLPWY